ncbi:amidohydrolase [Natronorarus salvus]|uniref:amidohydrolase n=1 Tax=Natronorarus salvus TaxID=3117733 RepID=UPI002F26CBE3
MTTTRIEGGEVLRPDCRVERADLLVGTEDGEILSVGDPDEVSAGDETLDASGGIVIPGLVNAHGHAAMTLLRGYADDKPLDAWLREDVWPIEGAMEAADIRAGTDLALVEMIRSGTTAFCDMYFHEEAVADAVAKSGLRARLAHGVVTVGKSEEDAWADLEEGIEIADRLDGRADGRITTAIAPHSLTTVGEEYLEAAVESARDLGVPLHFHANETGDEVDPTVEERGMRPLEYADDLGMLGPDDFLAHGVHVDEREVELLADRETGVVHCPASNMKLASGMAPVQAMLDSGVTLGLGTDSAASNNDLDVFGEMRDAAMVGKLAADDASAVSAESVVGMATEGGASALGIGSGRIEPGEPADLAVVDLDAAHLTPAHDPVSHLAYAVRGSDVRHTVCDGRVLMRDRELLTLDERSVIQTTRDRAASLVERAD